MLHCVAQVTHQFFLAVHDLHGTTAQNIGRPYDQRIMQILCRG